MPLILEMVLCLTKQHLFVQPVFLTDLLTHVKMAPVSFQNGPIAGIAH